MWKPPLPSGISRGLTAHATTVLHPGRLTYGRIMPPSGTPDYDFATNDSAATLCVLASSRETALRRVNGGGVASALRRKTVAAGKQCPQKCAAIRCGECTSVQLEKCVATANMCSAGRLLPLSGGTGCGPVKAAASRFENENLNTDFSDCTDFFLSNPWNPRNPCRFFFSQPCFHIFFD